jgi:hypothetical protein
MWLLKKGMDRNSSSVCGKRMSVLNELKVRLRGVPAIRFDDAAELLLALGYAMASASI